ncbi:hypothetical protein V518_1479 [Thermoanaerobacterium aotearoense SCUT27]|uniref:Uncharacterized protein n=1 Tax=Thermoanaerobacterium aotearoense SCUT27 TaxID=1421016 RepID=W9EB34_9THEO|nr:hypothetical protein V518_1479 [Thermoanaerobacterium aotearoense SCUT27]
MTLDFLNITFYNTIVRCLGVAQLVARQNGVLEVAGSNPVTQTI